MNCSPVNVCSKKQGSVEAATFGSEFMAMKNAAEANQSSRYKLRMMGVPIEGPTYFFGDNQSVLHNVSKPESMIKKKSNSIAYHFVRECVAKDEMRCTHIKSQCDTADIATKVLPNGELRNSLIRRLLYDIYDYE